MASLTVTIKEELTLNGKDRGNTNSITISGVSETFNRILTVTNTEETILEFQASRASGSAIVDGTLQYLRITNIATTNTVDLRIQDTSNTKEYFVRIGASESFILFNDRIDANEANDEAISLSQIEKISADASGSSGETADIEIFAVAT